MKSDTLDDKRSPWSARPAQEMASDHTDELDHATEDPQVGTMMDDSSSNKRKKSSDRIASACARCNKAKARCNGEKPCSRCTSMGRAQDCMYVPSMRGKIKRSKRDTTTPAIKLDGPQDQARRPSQPPNQVQSPRSESSDKVSHLGQSQSMGPSGTSQRSDSFASIGRPEAGFNPGPSSYLPLAAQHHPQDHQHITAASHAHSTPKSTADSDKPQPRRFPSIGTVFGESSHHHLSTSRPIDRENLTTLPLPGDAPNPLGILAEATISLDPSSSSSPLPASHHRHSHHGPPPQEGTDYYSSSKQSSTPRTLKSEAPHIMQLISPSDAESLFETYWKKIHPHLPVLDRGRSACIDVASRSNYLFNAVCCVAARSFNIGLWAKLRSFARQEMTRIPLEKTLDVVQAHLLYSEWNLIPAKRFEQDMTWLRVGIAVRTAMDINLHRVALNPSIRRGLPNWLVRSIIRTWLLCYTLDGTLSAQLGKPSALQGEGSVGRYAATLKTVCMEDDVDEEDRVLDLSVAALTEWTQILVRAVDCFKMSNIQTQMGTDIHASDFPDLVVVFDNQLEEWGRSHATYDGSRSRQLTCSRNRLYHRYGRLVVLSYALYRAKTQNTLDLPSTFVQFQTVASNIIECFEKDWDDQGLARGCPDFLYTVLTFAVVSLLKSAQVRYKELLGGSQEHIFGLCRKAVSTLSQAATSADHLPAIQSVFLSRLLDIRTAPSYTPRAMLNQPLDLDASMETIGLQPERTYWPPTAPTSPLFTEMMNGIDMSALNESGEKGSHDAVKGQNVSPPKHFWSNPDPNHLISPNSFDQAAQALQQAQYDPNDPRAQDYQLPIPEVPTSSLALSLGAFVGDTSVRDVLFANDSFWMSILETQESVLETQDYQ